MMTSHQAQILWMYEKNPFRNNIIWRHYTTLSGVFRIFPGIQLPEHYDPTTREWYVKWHFVVIFCSYYCPGLDLQSQMLKPLCNLGCVHIKSGSILIQKPWGSSMLPDLNKLTIVVLNVFVLFAFVFRQINCFQSIYLPIESKLIPIYLSIYLSRLHNKK